MQCNLNVIVYEHIFSLLLPFWLLLVFILELNILCLIELALLNLV